MESSLLIDIIGIIFGVIFALIVLIMFIYVVYYFFKASDYERDYLKSLNDNDRLVISRYRDNQLKFFAPLQSIRKKKKHD